MRNSACAADVYNSVLHTTAHHQIVTDIIDVAVSGNFRQAQLSHVPPKAVEVVSQSEYPANCEGDSVTDHVRFVEAPIEKLYCGLRKQDETMTDIAVPGLG